jgi:hypothetical protein
MDLKVQNSRHKHGICTFIYISTYAYLYIYDINIKHLSGTQFCFDLLDIHLILIVYRVAAIFPEQFQSFTYALKNCNFNEFLAQNHLSCVPKGNKKQTDILG